MAHYEIEVWDKSGQILGDIRMLCTNLEWHKELNGSESLEFDIDLNRFEQYLRLIGITGSPYEFLECGRSDIRVKRNGVYILGTNVYQLNYRYEEPTTIMGVKCVGYLNFYKTQFVTASFADTPQQDILWGIIDQCNQKHGGDYGIRRGYHVGETVTRTRNYTRKEVALAIQQMSQVIGGCDFAFTPDKLFNTYDKKGAYRPDVVLRFGEDGNIVTFDFNRSIAKVANFIYGLGSGNGEDAIQSTAEDTDSEDYLYRREKVILWNSVKIQDTLDEHTDAALHQIKDVIELPSITVRDGAVDLSTLDVGDTITIDLNVNFSLEHIDGEYRIQTIDCVLDDNDCETTTIGFDDLDIDQIIAVQEENDES